MRAYTLLLHLYPASFRCEYGEEMLAVFSRQRRQAATPIAIVQLWLFTVGETFANAALVHLDVLRQDLAYTVRALRRTPGFAVTAILLVALGIGATTAVFSVTDFVLIRPLPFPEPRRLVTLLESTPGYPTMELSAPNYRDWTSAATSFESTGVYHANEMTMTGAGEPRRMAGISVSAEVLPTLDVAPLMGRWFTPDDDRPGAPGTVILSYQLWQTEFGADQDIIGRRLVLDDEPYAVVGVMPREFRFPRSDVLFWTTNRFDEREYAEAERTDNWVYGIARLKRGVTIGQAAVEMNTIAAASRRQHPKENKDTGAVVAGLGSDISDRSETLLLALSGAAACVLLIACANLANLLLARSLSRRRELAVRAAIGAGRERLARQLLTESLLLASVGGVLGVAIAIGSVPLLSRLVPTTLPIANSPSVDVRVMLFALALTICAGVGFGMAPLVRRRSSIDLDGLREGSRSGGGRKEHVRAALVIAEIAASMVLLVSAGLLLRALLTVQAIDPGFNPEGVLTLRTELPMPQYRRVAAREAFYARVLESVRALPGVTAAGYVSFLPMSSMRGGIFPVSVKGDVDEATDVRSANSSAVLRYVTPGYFQAMAIPIVRGRDVNATDRDDRPAVAVVSESFVKRFWPGADPIGRHFTFVFGDREVVGVVGDVRFRGLERQTEPQVYLPSQQVEDGSILFYVPGALAVRTTVPPTSVAQAVRDVVRRAEPKVPITEMQTLDDLVGLETASRAAQVRVLAAFAVIAFVLAAVGIHGLLSFAVSQRTSEIGVRIALGAQPRDILSMVLSRALMLAVAGVVPGLVLANAAAQSMRALLAGVKPADARTLVSAVGLCVLMTVCGSIAPTLRALGVDPLNALRAE